MAPAEIKKELRRIAKNFRMQEREDRRGAKRHLESGKDKLAEHLNGNASAMKYCAEHVERLLSRIS